MSEIRLLPTDKKTARERLEELTTEEYREEHKVYITSIRGYDGPIPEIRLSIIREYDTIRIFPDGVEAIKGHGVDKEGKEHFNILECILYDDSKKYKLEFAFEE